MTFNQVGRDLPYGGMNEAGLVIENMTLSETEYAAKDNRSAIGACQWIQFQLDNFSTIEEVIASDTLLRIEDANSKFHFLVCDRSGHCAVIEFLNGKMIHYTGKSLPVEALANSTYKSSIQIYESKLLTQDPSLQNFCTAARQTHQNNQMASSSIIDAAFGTLRNVSQGPGTKWSIVYDITNLRIFFKIFETPEIVGVYKIFKQKTGDAVLKSIDFKNFDFDCHKNPRALDLNYNAGGPSESYFVNYSTAVNREFIDKAFSFFKGWGIPITLNEEELSSLAKYPESFECMDKRN